MAASDTTEETVGKSTEMTQPIIVDLGRKSRKKIKDLKNGRGPLWNDVQDVIDEVKESMGDEAAGKVFVPVVMVYRTRPKRQRLEKILFPGIK